MQGTITDTQSSGRRHRHRSRRRKAAESIGLIFGVPLLLLVVLAFSVDLIEYHPMTVAIPSESRESGSAGSGVTIRRTPIAVLEIPQMPPPLEMPVP